MLHHQACRLHILLAMLVVVHGLAFSQDERSKIEIQVGEGWSMTTPSLRSILISVPEQRRDEETTYLAFNLNKTVTLLQQKPNLEFIIGVTPVVLLELATDIPRFSVEAGVGANFISMREIGGRKLGSNFLFSPTISAGIEVPWLNNVVGVFYMFRHLSNAGFFEDNDGVNFQYIIFSMSFPHP